MNTLLIAAYCCYTLLFEGTGLRRLGPPESSSAALNNQGQAVVGGFDGPFNLGLRLYEGGSSTAIVPRPGGLEVELLDVIDMNDAGVILARGWIGPDDGSRETGYLLLSPVPEPATYPLWAGACYCWGLMCAAGGRNRTRVKNHARGDAPWRPT